MFNLPLLVYRVRCVPKPGVTGNAFTKCVIAETIQNAETYARISTPKHDCVVVEYLDTTGNWVELG